MFKQMKKLTILTLAIMACNLSNAQESKDGKNNSKLVSESPQPINPTTLWDLGRVSAEGLSADGKTLVYGVSNYNLESNSSEKNLYTVSLTNGTSSQFTDQKGGETVVQIEPNGDVIYLLKGQLWKKNLSKAEAVQLTNGDIALENVKFSPDGKQILFSQSVLVKKYHSTDKYPELPKSDVYIYDNLDYRHWDTFNACKFSHPFVANYIDGKVGEPVDLLKDQAFYSPKGPSGGAEAFACSLDS
ncbi:MAG TPA: hypothetical protein DCG88_23705 [Sphingobacterium sp.]|nr:hypothetical protein [Sphingobacterium sp.]